MPVTHRIRQHTSRHQRDDVGLLLVRAQDAGTIRADLNIDDLMTVLAGTVHTIQHAGCNATSRQHSA
jgi:hypothetical protein